MDYFPHDTGAMGDDKLIALRLADGLGAVAVYWAVLEKIYSEEKPLKLSPTDVGSISVSYMCGIGFDELREMVFHMVEIGLFEQDENDADLVHSPRADSQIDAIEKKRETARRNGKKRSSKSVGKSTRSRKATDVGSTSEPTDNRDSRNIKDIGSYKKNQISDSGSVGADAAASAPPSPPKCPLCGVELVQTGIESEPWWCNSCRDSFKAEKVVA